MTAEQIERFERIIKTPLGSRVMLPTFGSRLHELIDKTISDGWVLQLRRYIFEAFFNERRELWDADFNPVAVKVEKNESLNDVLVYMTFKNGLELEYEL